ncbi:MAG TPA: bifunctional diaminohydroxyphosphoribosylaminopyrimidine deaminase/5-amino-6-(5-phosphoribosylamino)uracil reductase RibD [Rhizobiales bacterium]|nr:riboflavin biosynthesis protein RibD [bacterium BMS3Bbin10]HDO52523.1 bifunctional diaminohydroxyphosphoribosylaminopyrimidine deaminase/5-amino-6-(5-phosphoribosylamino)uracil reductase RibD [Hyphomicrobiales bacterium]
MSASDEMFMRGALALARRALGQTWPNPAVGAVLVRPGDPAEIIARGWTMPGGRPHAEHAALEKAGARAKGCTLYVTLEPCAHHGQTPPCADAIVEAGVSRVVCSAGDPDPRVSGKGFARLRKAGIEVGANVLGAEGGKISLGHHLRVTQNRPLVQLKIAVGADGRIARGAGAPVWVTGEVARAHGHLLRARADAILVGRGTVVADDPMLTCRLPGMEDRSPVRVVLDSNLTLGQETKLVASADKIPLWIFCDEQADENRAKALEARGAQITRVATHSHTGLDPRGVLAALAKRGVTRVLVEGGPRVSQSFWSADLVDEVYVYQGPDPAGAGGLNALADEGLDAVRNSTAFGVEATRALGRDTLTLHRRSDV